MRRPVAALLAGAAGSRTPGSFEGGTFKLRNANSAGAADATFFGDPRGFPVAGDWNGDGIDDVASTATARGSSATSTGPGRTPR